MEVTLLSNVKSLGLRGENKTVPEGYYRNYLLPKGLAIVCTDPLAKQALNARMSAQQSASAEIASLRALVAKITGQHLVLTGKVQPGGNRLFGAIQAPAVALKLGIEPKLIKMLPLKTIGEHSVELQFPHNLRTQIKVTITASS